MTSSHRFDPAIFREYDVRGTFGKNFSAEEAYLIARAFAMRAAAPGARICLGRDGRKSSPALHEAVSRGILDAGVDVLDIGIGPTPMLYFAAYKEKTAGAIMITGSHNPPADNGMKFVLGGKAFFGADIKALEDRIEAAFPAPQKRGAVVMQDERGTYLSELLAAYQGKQPLNVAWDAGNGSTGEIMAGLAAGLPGKHTLLNEKIDGDFPAHHPDPTVPKNLEQLRQAVRAGKCDVGIAFDGDGDRIGVIDDEGEILSGDHLLMLYAVDVLRNNPGAILIADVKASGAVFDEFARLGGKPLMWKTGHSTIKAKMAETKAAFAGEITGHIFFADKYYGYDDALYAAVRLLSLLSREGRTLSEWKKSLPTRVNTPELRFPCDEERKFAVIDEVKARLKAAGAPFSEVDGVRVTTEDGWWLLRASNTQAVLTVRCEAHDAAGLSRLKEDLRQQLSLSKVALP